MLGLALGASENAQVVKDLLRRLIERGLDAELSYLFVIDGGKALRSAIDEMFGARAHVQRWRTHKLRNVLERLPKGRSGADQGGDDGRLQARPQAGHGQDEQAGPVA